MELITEILLNTILLFAIVFIVNIVDVSTTSKNRVYSIFMGFIVGFLTVVIIYYGSYFSEGIIYDTRTVLLSTVGLFFTPLTAIIAGIIAIIYRIILGGAGIYAGISSIIFAVTIGILWKKYFYRKYKITIVSELLLFGLIVHITMFLSQLLIPTEESNDLLLFVAAVIVPIFSIATALLSLSLINHNKRVAAKKIHSRYQQVFEQSQFGIIQYDKLGVIQLANQEVMDMFGLKREDIIGFDMLHQLDNSEVLHLVEQTLQGQSGVYEGEYTSVITGKTRYERATHTPTIVDNVITGGMVIIQDLSELKETKDTVEHIRKHDILTGLYNRQTFDRYINTISSKEQKGTILLLDINGLRVINEVYNYDKGNQLLVKLSAIIQSSLPKKSVIARYGGDEFIAHVPDCNIDNLEGFIKQLHKSIDTLTVDEFDISVSVGMASNCESNLSVYTLVSDAESNLFKDKMLQSESSSNAVIQSLKTTLFERSDETQLHADRMADLAGKMAQKMDFTQPKTNELKLLAILHDIGKIGIGDAILKKPGKLTIREYDAMKLHPTIGYKMANAIPQLESIAYPILTHHEWYDGTGYPKGLKQNQIPLVSRILSIIDAYDAMTNDRIYRKALSKKKAIQELKENKGTQFDPELVDIFLSCLEEE